jgi:hypothetical protein
MSKRPESNSDYLVIDHGARVGTTSWGGAVVIGSEAIYLFKESLETIVAHGGHGVGMAIFGLLLEILQAIADRVLPVKDLAGGSYADVPESVREHPSWPVREPVGCPVLIVPRASVRVIYHVRGAHEIMLEFQGAPIAIHWGQFGGSRIKDFLATKGWPLSWNGELSNLSASDAATLPRAPQPRVAICAFAIALLFVFASLTYNSLPQRHSDVVEVLYIGFFVVAVVVGLFGAVALHRGL